MPYCNNCGKENSPAVINCPVCGKLMPGKSETPVSTEITIERRKSPLSGKITGILLLSAIAAVFAGVYFFTGSSGTKNKTLSDKSDTTSTKSENVPGKYPIASTRLLKEDDVLDLTSREKALMRNEIYARHGYIFENEETLNYFKSLSWYKPRHTHVWDKLSATEKENIELINRQQAYDEDFGKKFGR